MPTIYIDNKPYVVKAGQNLLQACLRLGCNLPYFCWHPALHSVGACRQCAVIVFRGEHDTQGQLVMSCMTPVREGLRLSVDDPRAREFRRGIIELLMIGHPHDCPVCDEGGECHLQDMTVLTGHTYRRGRFAKRTFVSQDLGPFVAHEMNRCIACYRCVRFYCDYAGGRDFGVQGWHDGVYFGRFADGVLQSEFSGNLVEICPTGVFTDNTRRRHYTRKWDLATAPSICPHCCLGCNTLPGERDGQIRVVSSRYNGQVNRYFLCDRGRFGYEFSRDAGVLAAAKQSGDGSPASREWDWVRPGEMIGIGSPRASVESNFALRRLVGAENFFSGERAGDAALVARVVEILQTSPAATASLRELDLADAVLILGEDVTNTAPMAALAIRQASMREPLARALRDGHIERWQDHAVRQAVAGQRGPIVTLAPHATKLDDVARSTHRLPPADIARLATAVAGHVTRASRPRVCGGVSPPRNPPNTGKNDWPSSTDPTQGTHSAGDPSPLCFAAARTPAPRCMSDAELAAPIADALLTARRPVIVFGTSLGSRELLDAAATLADALAAAGADVRLFPILPAANSLGLALLAPRPTDDILPHLAACNANGKPQTVVAVEVDLFRILPPADADALFANAARVVALDGIATPTTARAAVALPAASVFQSDGTFVNNEGRAQRFFRVCLPPNPARESWRWLTAARNVARASRPRVCGGVSPPRNPPDTGKNDWPSSTGQSSGSHNAGETPAPRETPPPEWDADGVPHPADEPPGEGLADLHAELAAAVPPLAGVLGLAPSADFRIHGQRVPRQHHRHTGRTAMHADATVREPATPGDAASPLAFTMEGADERHTPAALLARYWSPGWNSHNALTRCQPRDAGTPRSTGVSPMQRPPSNETSMQQETLASRPDHHGQDARGTHGRDARATGGAHTAAWLILPAWHIFGSEELSVRAPAVAQRIPEPYLAVAAADAAQQHWTEGDLVDMTFIDDARAARMLTLPLFVRNDLPAGIALLPAGLPSLPFVPLPAWAKLSQNKKARKST